MKNPQIHASNPSYNIWVCASAGTGKTKTLIDRILRILLKNVSPSQIVCLTYTRAACAQMKTRLYDKLHQWTNLDTEYLNLITLSAHLIRKVGDSNMQSKSSCKYTLEVFKGKASEHA